MSTYQDSPNVDPLQHTVSKLEPASLPFKNVSLHDFAIGDTIGTGTFARVNVCHHCVTRIKFALKSMSKREILRLRQVQHVLSEKHILSMVQHPNIIKAYATFSDSEHIHLLLEYVPGGELFGRLRESGRFSEKLTMFYAANIILALDYLHSHGIIFRDVKPENILVCSNGYLKIADFGFAKEIDSKTWSVCGTPEYIAPEIMLKTGHGFEADWWSLGILIFEMLTGLPPFYDKSNKVVYDKILSDEIEYPRQMSVQAQCLIRKLLVRNPTERLGHKGAAEIKNHKCFQDVDFEKIFNQSVICPSS